MAKTTETTPEAPPRPSKVRDVASWATLAATREGSVRGASVARRIVLWCGVTALAAALVWGGLWFFGLIDRGPIDSIVSVFDTQADVLTRAITASSLGGLVLLIAGALWMHYVVRARQHRDAAALRLDDALKLKGRFAAGLAFENAPDAPFESLARADAEQLCRSESFLQSAHAALPKHQWGAWVVPLCALGLSLSLLSFVPSRNRADIEDAQQRHAAQQQIDELSQQIAANHQAETNRDSAASSISEQHAADADTRLQSTLDEIRGQLAAKQQSPDEARARAASAVQEHADELRTQAEQQLDALDKAKLDAAMSAQELREKLGSLDETGNFTESMPEADISDAVKKIAESFSQGDFAQAALEMEQLDPSELTPADEALLESLASSLDEALNQAQEKLEHQQLETEQASNQNEHPNSQNQENAAPDTNEPIPPTDPATPEQPNMSQENQKNQEQPNPSPDTNPTPSSTNEQRNTQQPNQPASAQENQTQPNKQDETSPDKNEGGAEKTGEKEISQPSQTEGQQQNSPGTQSEQQSPEKTSDNTQGQPSGDKQNQPGNSSEQQAKPTQGDGTEQPATSPQTKPDPNSPGNEQTNQPASQQGKEQNEQGAKPSASQFGQQPDSQQGSEPTEGKPSEQSEQREGTQGEIETTQQPAPGASDKLRNAMKKLQQRQQNAQEQIRQAERYQQQARDVLDTDQTPPYEPSENGFASGDENDSEQHGDGGRFASQGPASTEPHNAQQQPWDYTTEKVDSSETGGQKDTNGSQQQFQLPSDWKPDQHAPAVERASAGQWRAASNAADRAIESGRVPIRHRDLIQRVFGRFSNRTNANPETVPANDVP
ncbi:MAG: hypothetical protein H6815_12965 [Phycisphaeraceae bacterium]|nr:hypothetical protein [Phycisphaeraceae bacterium]